MFPPLLKSFSPYHCHRVSCSVPEACCDLTGMIMREESKWANVTAVMKRFRGREKVRFWEIRKGAPHCSAWSSSPKSMSCRGGLHLLTSVTQGHTIVQTCLIMIFRPRRGRDLRELLSRGRDFLWHPQFLRVQLRSRLGKAIGIPTRDSGVWMSWRRNVAISVTEPLLPVAELPQLHRFGCESLFRPCSSRLSHSPANLYCT